VAQAAARKEVAVAAARAAAHRQELALELSRDQIAEALRDARTFLTRR